MEEYSMTVEGKYVLLTHTAQKYSTHLATQEAHEWPICFVFGGCQYFFQLYSNNSLTVPLCYHVCVIYHYYIRHTKYVLITT